MKKHRKKLVWLILLFIIIIVVGIIVWYAMKSDNQQENNVNICLGNGLEIISVGNYSGPFWEDGSDEEVEDVLMIKVRNTSDEVLQYAELILNGDNGEEAYFTLSTLPPNETIMVLEADRKKYNKDVSYTSAEAQHVVFFTEGISMHSDKIEVSGMKGAFNVRNLSEEDIEGVVYIYYKNIQEDLFYGGITYRAKIEDGIKAGETKQIATKHYVPETSILMFVTIGE